MEHWKFVRRWYNYIWFTPSGWWYCRPPERYRMCDEVYAQCKGPLKDYLQRNKLRKYSDHSISLPSLSNNNNQQKRKWHEFNRSKLKKISIGMHVQVNERMLNTRYGKVVYIRILCGIYDEFIGVLFD
jgi:hypothetical protein